MVRIGRHVLLIYKRLLFPKLAMSVDVVDFVAAQILLV
jgi:hypothetical protein